VKASGLPKPGLLVDSLISLEKTVQKPNKNPAVSIKFSTIFNESTNSDLNRWH